ncbi:MAG: hypothetical protein KJO79_09780, partial [Verrucomicrobiae bacterium]|nr:hypothetical protein [Verrucomicrobiae bacterium]NNJ87459.1 hypothetical protein [Akkermansiaceae bacterium]
MAAQQTAVPSTPPEKGIGQQPPVQKDPKADKPVIKPAAPEPEESSPELPKQGAEAVRLQIYLDQKHFGPGFIDGKPGMFTKLAIENYNTSLGRKKDDLQVVAESIKNVTQPYATAIIPTLVSDYVDPTLPTKRSLQAERKYMSYRSVAEFMAERYHTSEDLLIELNGASVVRSAKA